MNKVAEKVIVAVIFGAFLGSGVVFAAEEALPVAPLVLTDQVSVEEVARKRLFAGGGDEEVLKVQEELYVPYRSISLAKIQKEALEEVMNEKSAEDEEVETDN